MSKNQPATGRKDAGKKNGSARESVGSKSAPVDTSHKKSKGSKRPAETLKLKIIPLGGLDGIGKNMTVFEYGNDMIVVDAGLMFPDEDHPGVDLILPDYTYVLENSHKLRAILITHGHEDHTGALPYLMKDLDVECPIYGSKLTLGFIEGKFSEFGLKNQDLRELKNGKRIKLGSSFTFESFAVNHSIPDASGIFIKTPVANVLHTGDFKLDQTPIDGVRTDFAAIARFAEEGVDVMMADSTNARVPGYTPSEAEVGITLRQIIANAQQRVIVACFSSHIHRVQQICDAAIAAGRKIVVTGRSMLQNTKIARDLEYLHVPEGSLVDAFDAKDLPRNRMVVLCTGSQGEPLSALSRMANGGHKTIDIEKDDTVIFSATPVPGNEAAVTKVENALFKLGTQVFDKGNALVHVSGHAASEELKLMLAMVHPDYLIPVHGEFQHLIAHKELALKLGMPEDHVFVMENGDTLLVDGSGASKGEQVENGIVYVDGLLVGDISQVVLKDRQTLASDGIVTAVCSVSKRDGKPTGDPVVILRGVSAVDDVDIVEELVRISREVLEETVANGMTIAQMRRNIREALSSTLWNRVRRRPMIIPVILEV